MGKLEFEKNDVIVRIGSWRKWLVVDFSGGSVVVDELSRGRPIFSTRLLTPRHFNDFVVVGKWNPWEGEEGHGMDDE